MSFVDRRPDFGKFDDNGGRFVLTWNWFACVFGPFWYLFQGMWAKALVYFFAISIVGAFTGGFGWLIGVIVLGAVGNYDLYLLRRHDTHFWELPSDAANAPGQRVAMTTTSFAELKALRDQGLLTESEYAAKHARILKDAENARTVAALERGLRAGVLTREEFEQKKRALRD